MTRKPARAPSLFDPQDLPPACPICSRPIKPGQPAQLDLLDGPPTHSDCLIEQQAKEQQS